MGIFRKDRGRPEGDTLTIGDMMVVTTSTGGSDATLLKYLAFTGACYSYAQTARTRLSVCPEFDDFVIVLGGDFVNLIAIGITKEVLRDFETSIAPAVERYEAARAAASSELDKERRLLLVDCAQEVLDEQAKPLPESIEFSPSNMDELEAASAALDESVKAFIQRHAPAPT